MADTPPVFEIAADRLASLYPALKCDGCGTVLTPSPEAVWVKAGCGYYCPACQAAGRHLACRI